MAKAPKGKTTHRFVDAAGREVDLRPVKKLFRDALKHHHGVNQDGPRPFTQFDLDNPIGSIPLTPSENNPICQKCEMFNFNSANPFMPYFGSKTPLITVVFEGVSTAEDRNGYITAGGAAKSIKTIIDQFSKKTGVRSDDCRFIALTRCAHRIKRPLNYKGKGQYCKHYAVQDLIEHPPKLIMPIGTVALGLLNHKGNVQNWGGRILTWRGWPDDWLTDPDFVKAKEIMIDGQPEFRTGHPLFGAPPGPDKHILLYPVQSPRLIQATQNEAVLVAWGKQIIRGIELAKTGQKPPVYDLEHYRLLYTPDEVIQEMQWLIDNPGTLVCYDTETEGLYPFFGQAIVFMMFRYTKPDGTPVAIGFPWDYKFDPARGEASPLLEHLPELRPYVERALTSSIVVGHNLTFDVLFTYCNLTQASEIHPLDENGAIRDEWRTAMARLNALATAAVYDTWHMAYTRRQQSGSLGLEVIAYDYVPELAGYEEELTLLIDLEHEKMHPDAGGHYARCPRELWESHFKPYVMGDVEVCYRARDALQAKLDESKVYRIPIASTKHRGYFRYFQPPNRAWLYDNIMSPASRVLTKMMGRGMFIDQAVLTRLEREMPKAVAEAVEAMKNIKGGIVLDYIREKVDADPERYNDKKKWELDLESKDQLRDILFERMRLDIQRLTKSGRKLYGEEPAEWDAKIEAAILERNPELRGSDLADRIWREKLNVAALDKFTLNKLAVDYEEVRPLQNYRKIHKLYGTYVRPLRNYRSVLDKKERTEMPHLTPDGTIHAQFLLTGTRGGRLSSRNPNLQQLPKEGYKPEGMKHSLNVKEMYVSRFGKRGCLYGSDFSQIELRLLAALSGDPTMVDAYFKDVDLHTLTTSKIFNLSYETFSKDHMKWLEENGKKDEAKELKLKRDIGKTVNFLTGYGGGAFGLQTILAAKQQYKQIEECEEIINSFFETYPAVKDLLAYYKRFIEDHQVAVSVFGRVRVFEEVLSSDREIASKALRAGCNHLIQSTASDMMLICLSVIEDMMREEGLDSMLVSTVHDSLVIDAVRDELPKVHGVVDLVLNNMPDVFKTVLGEDFDTSWMIVPFAGDSDVGHNYADMRGIPQGDHSKIDWDKLLAA